MEKYRMHLLLTGDIDDYDEYYDAYQDAYDALDGMPHLQDKLVESYIDFQLYEKESFGDGEEIYIERVKG